MSSIHFDESFFELQHYEVHFLVGVRGCWSPPTILIGKRQDTLDSEPVQSKYYNIHDLFLKASDVCAVYVANLECYILSCD